MRSGWNEVRSIAEEQWGLVTKRQIEKTGIAWSTVSRQVGIGGLERVAHGVYRLRGGAEPEHLALRAAWLQLAPEAAVWERRPEQGVVSHRSAAHLYGIGHLAADSHEFTLPRRKQTRREDVWLHRGDVGDCWVQLRGLPVTKPSRIAADLLAGHEDPGAVAQVIADALRTGQDHPAEVAEAVAPFAAAHGLSRGGGREMLQMLLELSGDPRREVWLDEVQEGDAK